MILFGVYGKNPWHFGGKEGGGKEVLNLYSGKIMKIRGFFGEYSQKIWGIFVANVVFTFFCKFFLSFLGKRCIIKVRK